MIMTMMILIVVVKNDDGCGGGGGVVYAAKKLVNLSYPCLLSSVTLPRLSFVFVFTRSVQSLLAPSVLWSAVWVRRALKIYYHG